MHWILQDEEDNAELAVMLDRMGISHSVHSKLGEVAIPEPDLQGQGSVIVFGYYSALEFSKTRGYRPGVFDLRPYIHEKAWQPFLLNRQDDALFVRVCDVREKVSGDARRYFVRPVEDSKTMSGTLMTGAEIVAMAAAVADAPQDRLVPGKLRPETELLLSKPVEVRKEWRVWVVAGKVVTWSLYKVAGRMVVRPEIDDDALAFVESMIQANPGYQRAYVIDICRTDTDLRIIETNCINASGYYDANLQKLIEAMEDAVADGVLEGR